MSRAPVEVETSSHDCHEGRLKILMTPAPAAPYQFNLVKEDGETLKRVATSTSPRELSNWAFSNGAKSVAHDYDLRLTPDK